MRKIKSSEMMTLFDIRQHGRNLTGESPEKLTQYIPGWINYFKKADIKGLLVATDEWMRRGKVPRYSVQTLHSRKVAPYFQDEARHGKAFKGLLERYFGK